MCSAPFSLPYIHTVQQCVAPISGIQNQPSEPVEDRKSVRKHAGGPAAHELHTMQVQRCCLVAQEDKNRQKQLLVGQR